MELLTVAILRLSQQTNNQDIKNFVNWLRVKGCDGRVCEGATVLSLRTNVALLLGGLSDSDKNEAHKEHTKAIAFFKDIQ